MQAEKVSLPLYCRMLAAETILDCMQANSVHACMYTFLSAATELQEARQKFRHEQTHYGKQSCYFKSIIVT